MSGPRCRRTYQAAATLLLSILAQSEGGCSLAAVVGPPATPPPNPALECTTNMFFPITGLFLYSASVGSDRRRRATERSSRGAAARRARGASTAAPASAATPRRTAAPAA